jgi:hypothetical protein
MNNSANNCLHINDKDHLHHTITAGLKFICRIGKNEKINTSTLTIQDNSSWLTGIVRMLTVQNRIKTMYYIKNVIQQSFEVVEMYIKSKDDQQLMMAKYILQDIHNCQNGLRNLQDTYNEDRMFACTIESFIQDININLLIYKNIDYKE